MDPLTVVLGIVAGVLVVMLLGTALYSGRREFGLDKAESEIREYQANTGQWPDMNLVHLGVRAVGGRITWPDEARAVKVARQDASYRARQNAQNALDKAREEAEELRRKAEEAEARGESTAYHYRLESRAADQRAQELAELLALVEPEGETAS